MYAYINSNQNNLTIRYTPLLRYTLWSRRPESTGYVNNDITQNKKSSKNAPKKIAPDCYGYNTHFLNYMKDYPCVQLCSQITPTTFNLNN